MLKNGYHDKKQDLIEFHIGDSDIFLVLIQDLPLRGMVSIRKNPTMKTRIVVGQVESIYLPHFLNKMYWNAEGHIPIIPKTEGMGTMVSLFITREFGFTFNLTEENLKEVLTIVSKKIKELITLIEKLRLNFMARP